MSKIFTIGHSTRSIDEFVALLEQNSITQLVDMRTIPKSRHNPQFGAEELARSLRAVGITYLYQENLGGLRPATKPSTNRAWHNESFRNYADYMQTSEFSDGVDELLEHAKDKVTAIMCAEAVPWRCHRSLVSDALLAQSIKVCEIISKTSVREHTMTKFAVVDGTRVTYPATDDTEVS